MIDKSPASAGSVSTRGVKAPARTRLGVKVKLQIAFGVVAVMTVIAATVAIMSFSATERGFQQVASREVPVMTDAMRLSVISGEISAAAARFVSAKTAAEQQAIAAIIREKSQALKTTMARVRDTGGDSEAFLRVAAVSQRLDENLRALEKAISERSQLRATIEARLEAMHNTHARISEMLSPIVDESYFEVVSTAEDVGKSGDRIVKSLVNEGLQRMQAIVNVGAETNLVTGLLTAGALTSSPAILALLEDRFTASARRVQKQLAKLPDDPKFAGLKAQVSGLVKLADFKTRDAAGGAESDAARLEKVFRAHETLTGLLVTLVDDLNFDLVVQGDEATKRSSKLVKDLVAIQIAGLQKTLETAAQTHLITSALSEAPAAKDSATLLSIQTRFKAAADQLAAASAELKNGEVRKLVLDLIAFGQGDDSTFALRARELAAATAADLTIEDNVALQRELDGAVAALVGQAEASMNRGAAQLMDDLNRNRMLLLVVAGLSVVLAAAIGFFYVQRRLVRRLTSMGDAMRRLSSGETELAVPGVADRDELGEMARTLEVFRAGEIERQGLAERERAEQASQRERAGAVEQLIGEFRATVTQIMDAVGDNISSMEATARTLSGIAGEADRQAKAASDSSEATSSNVRTVAAASDELGVSIREISDQATQANAVVDSATTIARAADQLVGQLSTGAERIGDVIKLIRSIAEQTNLLALNATIEAARAGEAGRGFAVVAAEVKTLATQTAKATEDIAAQIGAIQNSTSEAVTAIRSITDVMGDISRFTTTIAAAVEEQSASTQEISRNIQEVAGGAKELAGNMAIVTEAIDETNRSAGAVLDASGALSAQATTLQGAVDEFLQRVAAA